MHLPPWANEALACSRGNVSHWVLSYVAYCRLCRLRPEYLKQPAIEFRGSLGYVYRLPQFCYNSVCWHVHRKPINNLTFKTFDHNIKISSNLQLLVRVDEAVPYPFLSFRCWYIPVPASVGGAKFNKTMPSLAVSAWSSPRSTIPCRETFISDMHTSLQELWNLESTGLPICFLPETKALVVSWAH